MEYLTPQNITGILVLMCAVRFGSYVRLTGMTLKNIGLALLVALSAHGVSLINEWFAVVVFVIAYAAMLRVEYKIENQNEKSTAL